MIKNRQTIRDFFEHLQSSQIMSKEEIENIYNKYKADENKKIDPPYTRTLTGIGAWFAAIFYIMFLKLARIIEHGSGAIIIGIISFGGAIFISRIKKTTFFSQLSLALAFAANGLILFGASKILYSSSLFTLVIVQAIICFVIYPLFFNNTYRFLSPITLVILITAWIIENEFYYSMNGIIAIEMILFGSLILQKKRPDVIIPLIYSSAAMLPATLLFMNLIQVIDRRAFKVPLWPSNILLCLGLIYLFIHLSGGLNYFRRAWFIVTTCAVILLGIFTTPGILVTIGLLVIGYAYGDFILSGFAYLFAPCFLVLFYYALNIDLAYKSSILVGSGLVLLSVRWIINYFHAKGKII